MELTYANDSATQYNYSNSAAVLQVQHSSLVRIQLQDDMQVSWKS